MPLTWRVTPIYFDFGWALSAVEGSKGLSFVRASLPSILEKLQQGCGVGLDQCCPPLENPRQYLAVVSDVLCWCLSMRTFIVWNSQLCLPLENSISAATCGPMR